MSQLNVAFKDSLLTLFPPLKESKIKTASLISKSDVFGSW